SLLLNGTARSLPSPLSLHDALPICTVAQSRKVPAPVDMLGFMPGDDRKLASWAKVVEYFQKLAAASDRVKFEEIGKSTMGAPFRSEEHTSELQSQSNLVCRLLLEKK